MRVGCCIVLLLITFLTTATPARASCADTASCFCYDSGVLVAGVIVGVHKEVTNPDNGSYVLIGSVAIDRVMPLVGSVGELDVGDVVDVGLWHSDAGPGHRIIGWSADGTETDVNMSLLVIDGIAQCEGDCSCTEYTEDEAFDLAASPDCEADARARADECDGGGCGCRLAPATKGLPSGWLVLVAAALWLARR